MSTHPAADNCARSLRILRKYRAHDSIGIADPGDFRLSDEDAFDARALLSNVDISPYCIDMRKRRVLFVQTPPGALLDAPFLYQAQANCASRLIGVPFALLHELASDVAVRANRLIFIYSTGRCGSTLVSNVLGAHPRVVSLPEPDTFTALGAARLQGTYSTPELLALLRSVVHLHCAPHLARDASCMIALKFRNYGAGLAQPLHHLFPDAKVCFLYRSPEGYLRSAVRLLPRRELTRLTEPASGMHRYMSQYNPLIHRLWHERSVPLSPAQLLSCLWISAIHEAHSLRAGGTPLFALAYEALRSSPRPSLYALLEYCELKSLDIGSLETVLARDAQDGTPLSRDKLSQATLPAMDAALGQMRGMLADHCADAITAFT